MRRIQRVFPWVAGLCLIALAVYAASPSFNNFNATQFSTAQNTVTVGPNGLETNLTVWGSSALTFGLVVQGGGGFRINAAGGGQQASISSAGVLELDALTASTAIYLNGSKQVVSLPNGGGAYTNDGSGVMGWFPLANLVSPPTATSITIPMGAWFINNITNGLDITAATSIAMTNTGDGFYFMDVVTNAVRTRMALPWDWDAGNVQMGIRAFCSGTNSSAGAGFTNVVFAVRSAAIASPDNETALTFSAWTRVTNHISTNAFVSNEAITGLFAPGAVQNANRSYIWEIARQGSDAGDTMTNDYVTVTEVRLYLKRNYTAAMPTASP